MCTPHAACQKFSLKYFHEQFKIREIHEIKDPQKFSAIQYALHLLVVGIEGLWKQWIGLCWVCGVDGEWVRLRVGAVLSLMVCRSVS